MGTPALVVIGGLGLFLEPLVEPAEEETLP